uniref:Apple domain-containing protein n=1 Tax=Syphacia muris TaxID=451379 RepID=A0A0N5AES2_9BILA
MLPEKNELNLRTTGFINYPFSNCTLNDGSATINQAMLTVASNSIYLENKCLSKQKSEVSKSAPVIQTLPKFQYCFRIRANAILYELKGIVVEEAKTLNDCLLACGQSRRLYHAPCMSLNWFKNTEQCFIHSASSDTKQLQRSTETDFYKNFCSEYDIFGEDKPARTKDLLYDEDKLALPNEYSWVKYLSSDVYNGRLISSNLFV